MNMAHAGVLLLLACVFTSMLFIQKRSNTVYLFCFCLFLGAALGLLRGIEAHTDDSSNLTEYFGKKVTLRGTVSEYPDVRTGYTFLTIGAPTIASSTSLHERVLVRAPLYPQYHYGDTIEVVGKLEEPKHSFGTSTSRFSYKYFLASSDIYSTIGFPQITLVSTNTPSFVGALYAFKDKCIEVVSTYIVEPAGGLLLGILFGIKHALSNETLDEFTTAGIVHIVVLSGYNIAIVISIVLLGVKRLPSILRHTIPYIAVALFIAFVGATPTALRAGIMAAIALYARGGGKEIHGLTLLSMAGAAMVLYEPKLLLYDPSFQLSFLATLGLILWTPHTVLWLRKIPERFGLREIVATTLSTQLVILPYILWYMGSVSLLGFVSNIVVVPLVPYVMAFGLITLLLGLIYVPLSMPFAYLAYGLLLCILWVAHTVASLSFGTLTFVLPSAALILLYLFQIYYLASVSVPEKS
jgi:competence protein ComEC